MDIFAAAAALAAAGPLAADELSVEYVRAHEFVGETTMLLEEAKGRQAELAEVRMCVCVCTYRLQTAWPCLECGCSCSPTLVHLCVCVCYWVK